MRQWLQVACLLAVPVLGNADTGFYFGGGTGGSQFDAPFADLGVMPVEPVNDTPFGEDSIDGSDVAFKVLMGWRIFDFLAIEAAYTDLGDPHTFACATFNASDAAQTPGVEAGDCRDYGWTAEADVTGWELGLTGIWPISDVWEVYARAGIFLWDIDAMGRDRYRDELFEGRTDQDFVNIPNTGNIIRVPRGPAPAETSFDGEDLTLALGGAMNVTDRVQLRAEGEWIDISDADTVWLLSLNAIFQF